MKDSRFIYSIIGTALCALVISLSIDVMDSGSRPGAASELMTAKADALRAVPVIRDLTQEGPGMELQKEADEVSDEQALEEGETAEGSTAVTEAETSAQDTENSNEEASSEENEGSNTAAEAPHEDGTGIGLSSDWEFSSFAAISSGEAVFYQAKGERKDRTIAVNAGHGTKGGSSVKTYCHPDMTPKLTGGTTAAGAQKAVAVSSGMTFNDGTPESSVTLSMARMLRDLLLENGYDVLMLRDGEDVQLDNVARTVIANNEADCHIAIHWDSDGLSSDKGCFYMSVPDGLKSMYPVSQHWQEHEALGDALIEGLKGQGLKIWGSNPLDMDLTQTSYSTIPSVDIELGNQCSSHTSEDLELRARGLLDGIDAFFGY